MTKPIFKYFYLTLLLIAPLANSFALQSLVIADNQSKNVTISNHELSRIFVKGDRIMNVRGVEGAYILTKDPVQGQVFIKPTPPYYTRPFNLFISTEQGRNFNLVVTSTNSSGQDIELKPSTPSKEVTAWEKNSEYSQAITNLITSMIKNEEPGGYSVIYPTKKKNKPVRYGDFTVTVQKQYHGNKLYGEALLIQNRCRSVVNVTESMFYQKGVRAITILHQVLSAKGETMVYRVLSEAGNE